MKNFNLSLILFLLLLTGCQQTNAAIEVITFQPKDYQVIFLPDNDQNIKTSEIYLDAIIELKAKYPNEINDIKMNKQNKDELEQTIASKSEFPALLITKNGKTIGLINGKQPKTEIMKLLEQTVNNN